MKVLVTGLGILSSVGQNIAEFTSALKNGQSQFSTLLVKDQSVIPVGAIKHFNFREELDKIALEDSTRNKILKATRRAPLPVQVSLLASLEAALSANLFDHQINREKISLIVSGQNINQNYQYEIYQKYREQLDFVPPKYALHFLDTDHLGLLSELLAIHGEGYTVGGASASGNLGLIQGYRQIKSGLSDLCIVVGSMASLSPIEIQAFLSIGAMGGSSFKENPEQASRPFDQAHEGFIYGQAGACMILESEFSAKNRNVKVWGELAGGALKLDGNHLTNPNQAGEADVMLKALNEASLSPGQIDYLNAHGSSSPLGDQTEISAIKEVFKEKVSTLWINSTKSITGHCLWSAGVVEAIATILQMNEHFVHPNLNLEKPIDQECHFVKKETQVANINAALKNSFGFGGINSCIVIKSYQP